MMSTISHFLSGIRIIDFSQYIPGPLSTLMLADMGADVIISLQMLQVADCGENRTVPKRGRTYLNGGAAYYNVYETADGEHIVVGAVEPKFWRAFAEAAGRADWIERQGEPIPQFALIRDVSKHLAKWTLEQCLDLFSSDDCCVSPVLPIDRAIQSQHVESRGLVRRSGNGRLQSLFPAIVDGEAPQTRPTLRPYTASGRGPNSEATSSTRYKD